jgi:hypothetical protein
MRLDDLTTSVWLGGIALQVALAAVLLVRKVWQKFPIFATYFLVNLAGNCFLYLVAMQHFSKLFYFYCYWCSQCVVLILGLGVVYEIFARLFAHYAALKATAQALFRTIALVLLIWGVVVIFFQPHGESGISSMSGIFFLAEEVVRLIEVGLVVLLFLSAGLFGLHWRQSEFGITLGLGSYAVADLIMVSLRTFMGFPASRALNLAIMLTFDFSVLIWMGYLLAPQAATQNVEVPEPGQLEQWNKALTELIYQ